MKVEVNTVLNFTEDEEEVLYDLMERLNKAYPGEHQVEDIPDLVNSMIDLFFFGIIDITSKYLLDGKDEC